MSSNKFLFLSVLLIALVVLPAVHAEDVRVVVNDVSPQPVEPGKDLTLRVTYTNLNGNFISNLPAVVDIRQPFTLKTATEHFENGFDLCGFCSRTNTYFITVDLFAKSGTYPIFIRLGDNASYSTQTVNVTVTGTPNILLASEALMNVTPSNTFALDIDVVNIGTGIANEIKIIPKSSDFVALGSSVATTNLIYPKSSVTATFEMSANENVNAGSYNLPFEINYKDEFGNAYNITQNIGVRVVNDALLDIESIKVASATGQQPAAGQPVSVIVRLQNVGHGNANSIQSEISCDGQAAKAFLGQLKRDEDAPAVFDLTIPAGGTQECTLVTGYTDDLGAKNTTSKFNIMLKNVEVPVLPVVAIIIIAAAVYYFRKKRASKKHAGG